jgi:(p)ppGpp synthase/HD superfamily hydrolase
MELTSQQQQLLDFVKLKHGDQKRKYIHTPYWTHCLSVAEIVSKFTTDGNAIEIALCHDLYEDTDCTSDDLFEACREIGYSSSDALRIITGVGDLTDVYTKESFSSINRKERKFKEAIRLGTNSSLIQSIKYADLIDNTSSIVEYDHDFAKVYLEEKKQILNCMRNGDVDLFIECCWTLKEAQTKLEKVQA